MDSRRRQQTTIRDAGARLVEAVLADPDLVEMVAENAIAAKIASSELIPADQLVVGAYEMVPVGKVKALELAIDEALEHLDNKRILDAIATLDATIPDPPAALAADDPTPDEPAADEEPDEPAPPGPGPEPTPEPAAEPARRRHRPVEDEPEEVDDGNPARPKILPSLDRQYDCKGNDSDGDPCGAVISGKQAQFSVSRMRVELCQDCVTGWDMKAQKVVFPEPEPEPEPEPDPEPDAAE